MERIFGFASSNGSLTAHGLYPWRKIMEADGASGPWACGFAYCKPQDDVILKRRPYNLDSINFYDPLMHNSIYMGIARIQGVNHSQSLNNTCPFRYRNWHFTMMGSSQHSHKINDWLSGSLPPYLKRNITGNTESEHVFHLFLSYLYDAGIVNAWDYSTETLALALSGTLETWKIFTADAGVENPRAVIIAHNSRSLIAVSTVPDLLGIKKFDGITGDCAYCRDHTLLDTPKQHPDFKGLFLMAEEGETPGEHGLSSAKANEIIIYHSDTVTTFSR